MLHQYHTQVASTCRQRPQRINHTGVSRALPSHSTLTYVRTVSSCYQSPDRIPTQPNPTQPNPRKNRLKKWHFGPPFFSRSTEFFVGWDCFLYRKQTARKPTRTKILRKHPNNTIIQPSGGGLKREKITKSTDHLAPNLLP